MLEVVTAGLFMLKEVLDWLLEEEMKLFMRNGVEPNSWVGGFESVVLANEIVSVDGLTEVDEDKIGDEEKVNCCSACSVDPRLLVLKDVVVSLLDDRVLAMRKGVEPNSWVVGFESVVVANEIVSVDGLTEDNEDKR